MVEQREDELVVRLDVPNTTIGDYITVRGAMLDAAAAFVDWERLHAGDQDAIDAPGRILLQIADRLPK